MIAKSRYAKAHGLTAGQSRQRFKDQARDVAELKERLRAFAKDADIVVAAIAFAELATEFEKIEVEWDHR
jgi:hypothetical protein